MSQYCGRNCACGEEVEDNIQADPFDCRHKGEEQDKVDHVEPEHNDRLGEAFNLKHRIINKDCVQPNEP